MLASNHDLWRSQQQALPITKCAAWQGMASISQNARSTDDDGVEGTSNPQQQRQLTGTKRQRPPTAPSSSQAGVEKGKAVGEGKVAKLRVFMQNLQAAPADKGRIVAFTHTGVQKREQKRTAQVQVIGIGRDMTKQRKELLTSFMIGLCSDNEMQREVAYRFLDCAPCPSKYAPWTFDVCPVTIYTVLQMLRRRKVLTPVGYDDIVQQYRESINDPEEKLYASYAHSQSALHQFLAEREERVRAAQLQESARPALGGGQQAMRGSGLAAPVQAAVQQSPELLAEQAPAASVARDSEPGTLGAAQLRLAAGGNNLHGRPGVFVTQNDSTGGTVRMNMNDDGGCAVLPVTHELPAASGSHDVPGVTRAPALAPTTSTAFTAAASAQMPIGELRPMDATLAAPMSSGGVLAFGSGPGVGTLQPLPAPLVAATPTGRDAPLTAAADEQAVQRQSPQGSKQQQQQLEHVQALGHQALCSTGRLQPVPSVETDGIAGGGLAISAAGPGARSTGIVAQRDGQAVGVGAIGQAGCTSLDSRGGVALGLLTAAGGGQEIGLSHTTAQAGQFEASLPLASDVNRRGEGPAASTSDAAGVELAISKPEGASLPPSTNAATAPQQSEERSDRRRNRGGNMLALLAHEKQK
jgi:hypothetical protein